MLLQLTRPVAFIDLESTGTDPATARIVELGIDVHLLGSRAPWRLFTYVNPGVPIPAEATAVHGITDAQVASSETFAEMAPDILRMLNGADLCGFGIRRFDVRLLCAEFARAKVEFPLAGRAVIDLLEIFHQQERRDLAAAVRLYLGREHDGAHSALSDVVVLPELLDSMLQRYPSLPRWVAELSRSLSESLDIGGVFRPSSQDGQPVFAVGKHKDRALADVLATDRGYIQWMLSPKASFLDDALAIVRAAIAEAERRALDSEYCRTHGGYQSMTGETDEEQAAIDRKLGEWADQQRAKAAPGCLFPADQQTHTRDRL